MVKTEYDINGKVLNEIVVDTNFLLTNKIGAYFLDYKSTKYRGVFTPYKTADGWSLMKSVDTISINSVLTSSKNKLYEFEKHHKSAIEKFFFHKNTLLYEVDNYDGSALLTLDVRDIYDFSIDGKKYHISKENDYIIIKFTKNNSFTRYIVIKSSAPIAIQNLWSEKTFEFDERRDNAPFSWYVYEALIFKIEGKAKISISTYEDKNEAISEANYIYYSGVHLKEEKNKALQKLFTKNFENEKIDFAYKCMQKSFDDLIVDIDGSKGIYAGLPWFFQVWTRDEAISLGALINNKEYYIVKEIVLRQTKNILSDGRVPNRTPSSDLGSADGVGLVFKRFYDLLLSLDKDKLTSKYLSKEDIISVKIKLNDALERLKKNYVRDNLIFNIKKETWMDTNFENDFREGARIEIQSLYLNMLRVMKVLCKSLGDKDYKKFEKTESDVKLAVRKNFFFDGFLYDGKDDSTIRPNVFLAYYYYPELLKTSEWKKVFKNSLDKLWLDWGAVSTIDRTNPLFCDEYTGMNNKSYHRGDSWYFINNIAAICLHKVDSDYFSRYIQLIINSSTEEILRMGALGCHAEVSSAKEQRSEGAISQAWSAATYIEMIDEVFGK